MKKPMILLLCIFSLFIAQNASCEESSDWASPPVITKAYELSAEKLYLEWQGSSPIYQVYMDGSAVANVIVNNAVISIKKGSHSITIYPVNETKNVDTKVDLQIDAKIIGGSLGIDLASLGLDPKKLAAGTPSEPLYIDYTVNPIFDAVPDKLTAETDFENRVLLSFVDRHNADEYFITIKNGTDINYIRFYTFKEESSILITRQNSTVTVCLDQEYLKKQGCMIPELNEKYQFTVQLRKYATDIVKGEKETNVIHESKVSNVYDYTPIAAWKSAPIITYASQISDGQISLEWAHDDHELGCEYIILKINKTFGIKTGEEVLGTTAKKEFICNDLMNGTYCFAIMPQYKGEKGIISSEINVEIKNEWVISPALSCEQVEDNQIRLSWPASPAVTYYHITVYAGNNESLLRFVNLDFSKYTEFDVPSSSGVIEHLFTYDGQVDPENGLKIKFEIYGIRRTENNTEQKSATSSQTIVIK